MNALKEGALSGFFQTRKGLLFGWKGKNKEMLGDKKTECLN